MKDISVAKTFKEYDGRINSIHFSWDGLNLITSSEDDQIVIYDCEHGTQKRLVNSQVCMIFAYFRSSKKYF
jgi:WD40 repeat protein